MKCGLLAASQEAAILGDISYHDYKGILVDPEERDQIGRNLGPFNKVLVYLYIKCNLICDNHLLFDVNIGFGSTKSWSRRLR